MSMDIRRSDRARHSRLTVTEAGEVVVVLPRRAPASEAERLVARHARWIERHVGRLREERARLDGRPPLDEGRVLEVDGLALRVRAVEVAGSVPARGTVVLSGDQLIVRLGRDGRATADVLEPWLRARARARIAERVGARARPMGVEPGRITIRDQSSRWGSASRSGALSFSWRLVLAPPFVLDAVVVHELAHLRIRGHSRRFWTLVEVHAPRTPEARRWLREHAAEVRKALA
jgi:predicted metal-dependent hydrolase